MARSRDIAGPYELHPLIHPITSKDAPDAPLQRAGHGQIVETPEGEVYHTHLTGRPLPGICRSPLGRETGIQKCEWRDDGWLYLSHGGQVPAVDVDAPRGSAGSKVDRSVSIRHDFTGNTLPLDFQWLRTPVPERIFTLTGKSLRLFGRESIGSWFEQALVARRQEHFDYRAETSLAFDPDTYQQAAGLVSYYNRHKFHFLAVTRTPRAGRALMIMSCLGDWQNGRLTFGLPEPIALPDTGEIGLRADVAGAELRFSWSAGGKWNPVGDVLDQSLISDEGGRGEHGSFTGAFVGMAAFDTSGRARPADFRYFVYEGTDLP
jgi:xylan 1,4-beta-xylosidase